MPFKDIGAMSLQVSSFAAESGMKAPSFFSGFLKNYFSNSFQKLVSFFSNENDMSIEEMEKIMKLIQSEIDLKKEKRNN